jgi:membrane-bound lytic murein transglycosylase F
MDGCKEATVLIECPKTVRKNPNGQARGNEPVQYVEKIRGYYDLLVWLTEENHIKKNAIESEKIEEKHQTPEVIPTPLL